MRQDANRKSALRTLSDNTMSDAAIEVTNAMSPELFLRTAKAGVSPRNAKWPQLIAPSPRPKYRAP
jgi:hypothetical protein